jgi:pantoate--beta-alanine ligase
MPHVAFFGRKDFQQLAVISRMTADLNLPIDIVGMPIIREADGLAMSSRNVYLSDSERKQALALNDTLSQAAEMAQNGESDAKRILTLAQSRLHAEADLKIDYVKICNGQSLEEVDTIDHESVLLLAVSVGKTRLLDNGNLIS